MMAWRAGGQRVERWLLLQRARYRSMRLEQHQGVRRWGERWVTPAAEFLWQVLGEVIGVGREAPVVVGKIVLVVMPVLVAFWIWGANADVWRRSMEVVALLVLVGMLAHTLRGVRRDQASARAALTSPWYEARRQELRKALQGLPRLA